MTATSSPRRSQRFGRRTLSAVTVAAATTIALLAGLMTTASAATGGLDASFGTSADLWIDRDVLRSLPTSGEAWENLAEDALGTWEQPDIADNDSDHDVETLAGALYAVRMNDTGMRRKVVDAIGAAMGTERGGRTLALGRNLTGYVLAADIVGHRSGRFTDWVDDIRTTDLDGRTLVSTHEDRPNTWGTHAGAARIAAGLYLGDTADVARAKQVFLGWLGDRSAYSDFDYGDLDWQADPDRPVGINPRGATRDGVNVGSILADDQRRCECGVRDPAPKENYVWEALQGVLAQATLLSNQGHREVWTASDSAIRRAVAALYDRMSYPAEGDDRFLPYLIDAGLGTSYSDGVEARSGKSLGYTDWTHATGAAARPPAKSPTPAPPATTKPAPQTTTPTEPTTDPGSATDAPSSPTSPARAGTEPTTTDPGGDSSAGSDVFRDVESGAYYDHAVGWLAAHGITTGVSADRYAPSGRVQRGQMAAFLWRLGGRPDASGRPFADVAPDAYYARAAAWLADNGITTGVSADRYAPGRTVSRAQMVVFLYRFAGSPDVARGVEHFSDVSPSAYHSEATRWARANGITTGTSGNRFEPGDSVTRAQMAALLWRLHGNPGALDGDAEPMVR